MGNHTIKVKNHFLRSREQHPPIPPPISSPIASTLNIPQTPFTSTRTILSNHPKLSSPHTLYPPPDRPRINESLSRSSSHARQVKGVSRPSRLVKVPRPELPRALSSNSEARAANHRIYVIRGGGTERLPFPIGPVPFFFADRPFRSVESQLIFS